MGAPSTSAQGGGARPSRTAPSDLSDLSLPDPASVAGKLSKQLSTASGRVAVVVRLSRSPASLAVDSQVQTSAISAEQDAIIASVSQIDSSARVLGRVKILLNAVMFEIDAAKLGSLAADVRVVAITPVVNFQLDLGAAVPYIGATPAAQGAAHGGAGVRVAVLDSGIDYTHAEFGGAGTAAAYTAAYGTSTTDPRNTTRDGLFPTSKVVGGYDFVGEAWPNGPLAPDDDPIDCSPTAATDGCDGGHGTHVADIIAGAKGVAPDASLYAVKVCSAVASSCSGVALLEGMDFAADPNGDGNTDDHVDIVNMSLGSAYGYSFFDELSTAVEHASDLGILTVASAGNSADRPYIVGTPASAPSALAVAQTQVPSAKAYPLVINSPPSIAGALTSTATVDWAPIGAGFTGDVAYVGTACPGEALLANPAGKVALIDRGGCSVSLKTDSAAAAGAVGVLIGLTAPGDPFAFSFGGGTHVAPTLVITQADANMIKKSPSAPVNVTVSDATAIALVGSVVSSSSRGPTIGTSFRHEDEATQFGQLIKPEIGAPGAVVSAEAGTGTGATAFGGTSGAAPMVSGAAALMIASQPRLAPREVKARLMNTAETTVYTNPATQPGVLAPITRIGNGEVRVDRALAAGAAAFELNGAGASLSFGLVNVSRATMSVRRTVAVKNYTDRSITYSIDSSFRYLDDQTNGAVTIKPSRRRITVPAHRSRYFQVSAQIDGTKLRPWTMNSGSAGGDPAALNLLEYDGYITLTDVRDADNNLHMAWHVLPRLSPNVHVTQPQHGDDDGDEDDSEGVSSLDSLSRSGRSDDSDESDHSGRQRNTFALSNQGVGAGSYTALSLIGENPTQLKPGGQGSQSPNITARYLGVVTFPVPTTFCSSGVLAQFGVQTWQQVTHANYPLEIDIYLDTNRDGRPDYLAYTSELSGTTAFAADGRNVVYAGPVAGPQKAIFFTQHGTNSGAFILTACGEQIGISSADAGKLVNVDAYTFDNYFTGDPTSHIAATMGVLSERYGVADLAQTKLFTTLPMSAGSISSYRLYDAGAAGASPTESGLLLLNVAGGDTESLVIRANTHPSHH
ncbi:MAG: S8 family serine peptidase [Chloroflexales bacterium]